MPAVPIVPQFFNTTAESFSPCAASNNQHMRNPGSMASPHDISQRTSKNRRPCYFCREARTQCTPYPHDNSGICARCNTKQIPAEMCIVRDKLETIVRVYLENTRVQQSSSGDRVSPVSTTTDDVIDSVPQHSIPVALTLAGLTAPAVYNNVQLDLYSFDYTGCPDFPGYREYVSPLYGETVPDYYYNDPNATSQHFSPVVHGQHYPLYQPQINAQYPIYGQPSYWDSPDTSHVSNRYQ